MPLIPSRFSAYAATIALSALFTASCTGGGAQTGDSGTEAGTDPDGMSTGETSVEACPVPGQTRCNGVCTDPQTDWANCGACGTTCTAAGGTTGRCVAGRCVLVCAAGRADCNRMPADGCETDLATAVSSCGACSVACGEVANGTPSCADAQCGAQCTVPFQNCDTYVETGCESDAQTDPEHCGMCGRQCPWPANSDFSCARAACSITCRGGYDNCDRNDANGCEVSLVSGRNCGSCGRACDPGKVCARVGGAAPVCADRCPVGTTVCDGGCIDTQTEPNHCGACGMACPGGVNAAPDCRGGRCALRCRAGYADCDGNAANGCEVNLALSVEHCGACGNACPSGPNGTAFCAWGQCRLRCTAGTGDCDGVGSNGCEQDLRSNPRACGVCDSGCAAGVACIDGQCDGMRCPAGRIDCDAQAANGCEAEVRSDARNCGACGASCAPATGATNVTAACVAGRCNRACTANRADCDGMSANGCEADVSSDAMNCGACGARCGAPTTGNGRAVCNGRVCDFECERGFHRCGGVCASSTASESCGTRCDPCPAPENGVASCVSASSTCALQCNPGFLRSEATCEAYERRPARIGSGRGFTCHLRADDTLRCFGGTDTPMLIDAMLTYRQIAVGRLHVCGLTTEGAVRCFGAGEGVTVAPPMGVAFRQIAAGNDFNCGVKSDGTVACWGRAGSSALAAPSLTDRPCGVSADGTVGCFTAELRVPVPVSDVVQVVAGAQHACALKSDGTAVCWGSNFSGESTAPSGTVAQPLLQLGAGNGNSCALTTNATPVAWGNAGGRPAGFAPGALEWIDCGGNDTCAVLRDGTVRCNGMAGSVASMVPAGLATVSQVSIGALSSHACALLRDNTVRCWGAITAPMD